MPWALPASILLFRAPREDTGRLVIVLMPWASGKSSLLSDLSPSLGESVGFSEEGGVEGGGALPQSLAPCGEVLSVP